LPNGLTIVETQIEPHEMLKQSPAQIEQQALCHPRDQQRFAVLQKPAGQPYTNIHQHHARQPGHVALSNNAVNTPLDHIGRQKLTQGSSDHA
jgi:hypothetical protein